jgi:hypothetical protein
MATYLRLVSAASAMAAVGEAWELDLSTWDASTGEPTSAVTPTVTITDPSGATSAPVPVAGSDTGNWSVIVTVGTAGRWVAHLSTPEDAADAAVYVLGPTTAAGMPTVADCAAYLAEVASSWSTTAITDAFNAERSAQRDKCGERNPYPDSLREALLRRVARNLAMRRLPLAMAGGDADGGPAIIPGNDPEVRRLERPYRRLVIG